MEIRYDSYENSKKTCVLFYNNERTRDTLTRHANWHENLEIQLCHSGEGYFITNGEKFTIQAGDIVIANSNRLHYNGTETKIIYSALLIDSDFCKSADLDFTSFTFQTIIKDKKIADLFAEVIKIYYSAEELCKTAMLQIAVLRLVAELRKKYTASETVYDDEDVQFTQIKEAIRYIHKNYSKKITLDTIAKSIFTDQYTLSRKFKAFTGQTVVKYINNYRCERAKELIGMNTSVSEAAELCGFSNMSFFTRTFKSYTGKLPSDYKRQNRR